MNKSRCVSVTCWTVKSLTKRWIEAVASCDVCKDGLFVYMYVPYVCVCVRVCVCVCITFYVCLGFVRFAELEMFGV